MALIAGTGMCFSMNVIGDGSTVSFVIGVIIGLVGLVGMGVNYPIYKKMLNNGKQKYAFEIMELAKEISNDWNETCKDDTAQTAAPTDTHRHYRASSLIHRTYCRLCE